MFRLKIWLNPHKKEVEIKGKKYKISNNYQRKIICLNNLRIAFTVGLLIIAYLLQLYNDNVCFNYVGIVLVVQIFFLGIYYLALPKDIRELEE